MEENHSETYSLLLQTLVTDAQECEHLFNTLDTIPSIMKKAEGAEKSIQHGTFAERLIVFACVEGIHFSGSFAALFLAQETWSYAWFDVFQWVDKPR